MSETEITVQVFDDKEVIFNKLKDAGFEELRTFEMNDYYFSKYSFEEIYAFDYESLIKNSFLVRNFIKNGESTAEIIFKDKQLDEQGNVISEEKIKCHADSLENLLKIFERANLTRWTHIKQTLTIFKNDKFEFALQHVHGLGFFIEYEEDESMKDLSEQEKIDLMSANLKELILNLGTDFSCKKVYMKLNNDKALNN